MIQATEADSIDEGLEELRAAIRLDPTFGLPYADIADALIQKIYYAIERSPELVGEARTAALSAVALAPDSAEAHTALAGGVTGILILTGLRVSRRMKRPSR